MTRRRKTHSGVLLRLPTFFCCSLANNQFCARIENQLSGSLSLSEPLKCLSRCWEALQQSKRSPGKTSTFPHAAKKRAANRQQQKTLLVEEVQTVFVYFGELEAVKISVGAGLSRNVAYLSSLTVM